MSSSHCQAIKTVWTTIEPYLNLSTTVAVAQTCRGLHDEIVDADTRRIKVSRLSEGGCLALNNIHWPSLRSAKLLFSATDFPIFCFAVGYAIHLESLQLDMSEIFCYDQFFVGDQGALTLDRSDTVDYEPLLKLFGCNLARCTKLRDLGVVVSDRHNNPQNAHFCPERMNFLMLALTPLLMKRGATMNRVQLDIRRSIPEPGYDAVWQEEDVEDARDTLLPVATDFFQAIFSCPNLHVLEMSIPKDVILSDALLGAAGKAAISKKRSSSKRQRLLGTGGQCLHHLCLNLGSKREIFDDGAVSDAKRLLEYFSECGELEDVKMVLPSRVWEAHSDAVANILRGKQNLSAVSLRFGKHKDDDGKILEMLREATMDGGKCKIADLEIRDLFNVEGRRLLKLLKDVKNAGGGVEGWSAAEWTTGEQSFDADTKALPDRVDLIRLWIAHKENQRRDLKRWKEFKFLHLNMQRFRVTRRQTFHC